MTRRSVCLVLPFAPEERPSHDAAIAAAGAISAAAGGILDVLQLTPATGEMPARASDAKVRWWEVVSPHAGTETSPEDVAGLAVQAMRSAAQATTIPRLVLLPAAPLSEAAAALLAAGLGGITLGRCCELRLQEDAVLATRLAFGGRLAVELRADSPMCCASWRPDAGTAPLQALPAEAVRRLVVDYTPAPRPEAEVLPSADQQARLEGARLVVSGGRGVGGPEGFELLARIARRIGGALGGSLPAVDAGWVPVARQVGVSGKFVSPRVYVAVGISGTPQHLAGIASTSRIIAINKDADAPIFAMADVGAVADWRELLPRVAELLEDES